jgi:hypothetical protein
MFSEWTVEPAGGKMTMTPSTKTYVCPLLLLKRAFVRIPCVGPPSLRVSLCSQKSTRQTTTTRLGYHVRSLLLRLQGKHTLTLLCFIKRQIQFSKMARGKFNKRAGGKRNEAQSAEEIEQRNQRLVEFEEQRTKRRADAEEEEKGGEKAEGDDAAKEKVGKGGGKSKKPNEPAEPKAPVQETSAADHRRNMGKLEAVRRRRAVAERKREESEGAEKAEEAERVAQSAARQKADESDDDGDGKKKKKKSKEVEIPELTKIEIKKMKPAQMKEALKLRGLEIQGNAKTLTKRLVDYEEAR